MSSISADTSCLIAVLVALSNLISIVEYRPTISRAYKSSCTIIV